MIRSYWELHFGEQHNGKKGYGFKKGMPWYRRGGSSVCASNLALDKGLGHQHMRVVYYRGRIPTRQVKGQGRVSERCYQEAKENRIGASPVTRWQRPSMGVTVCLFIDQEKLLREHRCVEASNRKGRGIDDESKGTQLPKRKAPIRKEVNSEECHSAAKADLPITKKGTQMRGNG
ncbi:hypothetical protein BHE74_00028751 [Ensete ventricosum]|nr:hypothetical protein BHE74_00028751 [Ensete ventricosum]